MPVVSRHEFHPQARMLALLCSTALAGTVAISFIVSGLGVGTGAASAAEFTANDDASLRQAIQDANSDIDPTSTITLTDNITLDPATLPPIGRSITIDADGFMLRAKGGDTPGGNGRNLTFPVDPGGTVRITVVGRGHISGGDGANGADGAAGADGGDGGRGGDGLHIDSLQSLEIVDGLVDGGYAGTGGAAGAGGNGGNGGIGGNGIWLGSGDLINGGRIYGQTGSIGTGGVIGGNGGNGGNGVVLGSGTLTNNNIISAGTAAGAGAGADSGGDGGVGGIGVALGSGTLINNGTIYGSTGGTGGTGFSGDGGIGGAGGAGVTIDDGELTNRGTIVGGLGGNGGDSRSTSGGISGAGGIGGMGVFFGAESHGVVDANVTGGAGGNGGNGLGADSGDAFGGAGGAGIVFAGGGSINVNAAVAGGDGGRGGSADVALGGMGGVGIEGAGLTIAMGATGSVSGGIGAGAAGNGFAVNLTGGSNVIDLSGTTSQMTGGINVAAGDLEFVTSGDATIANVISGGGSLLFDSAGRTLTLSGINTYAGGTQLLGGTLSVSSDANLGDASGALTVDGGTLQNTAAFTTTRDIALDAGGGTFQIGSGLGLTGIVSGDGALTKAGGGTLTLSGENTYRGGTAVEAGTLKAAVTGALGSGAVNVTTGGTLDFAGNASAGSLEIDVAVAFLSFHDSASAATATVVSTQGGLNFYGQASAGSANISVGGGGGLSFNGDSTAGNATITAAPVDFYGNASAGNATITLNSGPARFHGNNTADGATIVNGAGSTVDISDLTASGIGIGSLSGDGTVFLGSKTLTLGGLANNDVIGGVIQDGGSGGSLVKGGGGRLTLNGVNTYTGSTTVQAGTLIVGDDSHSTASLAGDVDVDTGGTLGGSGTIGGNATVDGTLSAGNSPGTLTIDGNLTLNSGSTSIFEFNAPGVVGGAGNDLVVVHDNLTLGGALDARVAAAGYYRLFNYDGTLTGTFDSGTLTGTGGFTPLFPDSPAIRYDTPSQVNLSVLAAGQAMLFWDGANTVANGTVDGGDGTWSSAGANWTESAGGANGGWTGSVGVFAGSAGTVTVDGTQSFDTLQFKTDGYTLTGGTLALSPATGTAGALNIDNGVSTTIATTIADGTGNSLKKVGGGTLVLTGANTYTGGTSLLGGTLSVSSDANLGTASGALTVDGGTLRVTDNTFRSTARDIVWGRAGGGFDIDSLSNVFTVSQSLAGNGALTKSGAGTLRLSGANSYGGGTTISGGALTAMTTGALGTGPVVVAGASGSGAELRFNGTADAGSLAVAVGVAPGTEGVLSFHDRASAGTATIDNGGRIYLYDQASAASATIRSNGALSFNGESTAGTSKITIAGTGQLEFHGNATAGSAAVTNNGGTSFRGSNAADGATIVNNASGQLNIYELTSGGIGIGSLSGDGEVFLGSKTLTLGGLGKDDTIGGVIQGPGGSLVKTGAGTLTLNGVNAFTGLTSVDDGKLVVGDAGHATASLAGGVQVNEGGTLGGIGTVGSTTIASGGTIAPGNSIGTLTVKGDIAFAAGSTYLAELTPALDNDLIDATGKATIGGGTVHALKAAGVYVPGSRWTILGAGGGVTGTFDALDQNMPFVDLALAYDANHVYIDAARNEVAFCDVAMTFNQCSTGDGLESTGGGNPVYDAVAALPDANSARVALDALSGEIYASTRSALIEDSHFVRDAVNDRIRSAFGDTSAPALPVMAYGEGGPRLAAPDSAGPVAWGRAFGSWGSFDGDGNAAAMDTTTGGFLAGIDGEVASGIRLGLLAGYSHSTFDVDDRASSGSSDNYHLGLYAGGRWDALRLSGGLAYTWHDIETGRSVAFPGFSDKLTGDYGAGTFQAFGEAGYRIGMGAVSIEPFANLAYVNLATDGFSEKGGAAALAVRGETTETTFTTLGLHLASAFDLGGMKATARGTLGWRHAFGDATPASVHAFAGGDAFTVAGVPIARDAALVEVGLDLGLSETATLGLAYQGQFGSGATQNGFNARLAIRF